MKRRILFVINAIIPLALFLAAREPASWRPQLMAADSIEAVISVIAESKLSVIRRYLPLQKFAR